MSITKTLDTAGPYTAGDTIQYTQTVENADPDEAYTTNLTISSVSSATCTELPCVIPSIANGASEVITVMATITAAGGFDNSAGAYAFVDSDLSDNIDDTGNCGTADAAPVTPSGPSKPIPTLSKWALILMSALLGLVVFARQRKLM